MIMQFCAESSKNPFVHLWIVMAHALESCKDLKNIVLIWNLVKKAKTMNVFGCALQHLGLVAPSTLALPTN